MLLYEVQVRPLLHQLSLELGRQATLMDLPDSMLMEWKKLGVDYVWFMGVWPTTKRAREIAVQYWKEHWVKEIPSSEGDVIGSPYTIERYIPTGMTLPQLQDFSERVMNTGLFPVFDFVPNHFGLDCELAMSRPELFVQSSSPRSETTPVQTRAGLRHLAHGKDPYFAPWNDTVQVDYRSPGAHEAMCAIGRPLAVVCPGLRCDMSMLVVKEIFAETWKDYPEPVSQVRTEFWPAFRAAFEYEDSLLIAEAYWDKEEELIRLGFDYSYNKRVYDYLVRRQPAELIDFLFSKSMAFFENGVTFLENHDEPRAASIFPLREHKIAALFLMALPGTVLLHEGQLQGRRKFARIQLRVRPEEETDHEISTFYSHLLEFRKGLNRLQGDVPKECVFVRPKELSSGADAKECIVILWRHPSNTDAFFINLGMHPARVALLLPAPPSRLESLFSTEQDSLNVRVHGSNVVCELPAHGGVCVRFHED